jgi:hypothetical protein
VARFGAGGRVLLRFAIAGRAIASFAADLDLISLNDLSGAAESVAPIRRALFRGYEGPLHFTNTF